MDLSMLRGAGEVGRADGPVRPAGAGNRLLPYGRSGLRGEHRRNELSRLSTTF